MSFGFWIKYKDGVLFKRKKSPTQEGFQLDIYEGKLRWIAGGPTQEVTTCNKAFTNWNYVTLTAKLNGEKKIYVNGELCVEGKSGKTSMDSETKFYLSTNSGFIGTLDELKIWDVELTPNEVRSLFNSYKSD